ncbi:MAG: hypothetical protein NTW87_19840 [Planctomycetota bacterium]|nr:hypothetical protein [Planctomycetota bacterium]
MPEAHPLAAAHPRALRACTFLRQTMKVCGWGIVVGLVVLIAPFWLLVPVLAVILFAAFSASIVGYAVAGVLRLLVIALFFTRYSLAQLLGAILLSGLCVSLTISLPGDWKVLPAFGLVAVIFVVLGYVAAQDPEGPVYVPGFIKRAVEAQKSRRGNGEEAKPPTQG